MKNEYLDKVEENASVCTWSEKTQLEKGDSVTEGHTSGCFTFGEVDLVPTLEEYTTLLRCPKIQGNKAYVRPANLPTFVKKLIMIPGMSEQWAAARVQQKGEGKCISWASLRDLILAHPDVKRRVDVLALSIYGLVIFPKALGHIDEAVADLFNRLGKQNTPVPAILAETFRFLSACRKAGKDRFIGCAQLLLVWFHSHFWKVDKVPYRVFFKDYSPLKEAAARPMRDDITEERWIEILQNLREEDVMWKAPWMTPSEILYRCGSFDWVPIPGIWGVVGYTPLLVLRQYKAEQFIPATQGLAQSDFLYKEDHYKKKMREISEAWKKVCCVKILTKGPTKNLRVIPSELEVIKQEFERKNLELGRKIERLEEEKMYLSLDVDVQKIEVEKRVGLGKSSEQWQQEVQEERAKAEYWEKKF
ncbi:hypothetical protein CXB51_013688 [Gossypium anomalum]|uniref:DUF7745 domain-containing protein n=1 Tax=Gossypium anomalum TaxID=47600 RepID=A0A8J5YYY2_9ROSI|nr:hypothetical protein CXB51_013688 [Gossypium anomalum]